MGFGDRLKKIGSDLAGLAKDAVGEVQKKGGELADAAVAKGTELKDAAVAKGTELASDAAAKGTELKNTFVAKGTELAQQGQDLANKGLAAGEVLVTQGTDAVQKGALTTVFMANLEDLARGKADVKVKIRELHESAKTNPTYLDAFNAFAADLNAPTAAPKADANKTVQDAVNSGVTAVNAFSADLSKKKAMAELAVANAPQPASYYLG